MAVMLTVLVPLAMGVALLGQYIHVRQETQAAAREAAWSAAASAALAQSGLPDKDAVQTQLRSRRFTLADASIRSDAQAPDAFADPMLTTPAERALLKPEDMTLTVYQQGKPPSYLDKIVDGIGSVTSRFGLGNSLPPNRQGLVTAEVHANTEQVLGRNGAVLSFLGPVASDRLDFSAKTVLLVDSWDAAGGGETRDGRSASSAYQNRTVRAVIKPLVPTTWFGGTLSSVLGTAAGILGWIPIIGPGLKHFEFGRTAPDVVPADKLVPYKDVH
ncbi:hypothetical protein HNQ86_001905 [Oleiagrimonas soli]|nr:TadE/TadG family type IV pilus assembly protein [Oleiagrimonas soli]MBB6184560.1 hypothetical protein [Oleiagrimonas soli]